MEIQLKNPQFVTSQQFARINVEVVEAGPQNNQTPGNQEYQYASSIVSTIKNS